MTKTRGSVLGIICSSVLVAAAGIGAAGQPADKAPAAPAGAFTIDASHSSAIFKISHLGVSNFYGRFNKFSGSFALNADKPDTCSIDVTVDVASVDTHNSQRDEHLKSADFFNAGQFPTMTFKSTKVAKAADNAFDVTGDLTANGKTKSVQIKVVRTGEATLPKFGHRCGIETELVIKRADFGINYMPDMLGADVTLIVSLEGVAN